MGTCLRTGHCLDAISSMATLTSPPRSCVGRLVYAESPQPGELHSGWEVPPVTSWRRKRNMLLGAASMIRPSAAEAHDIEPKTAAPPKCKSRGCQFHANSSVSWESEYCCYVCKGGRGKHSELLCEGGVYDAASPAPWSLPVHGCIYLETYVRLKPPIPSWMIPRWLLRCAIPKLITLIYPLFLMLNERLDSLPFGARVRADAQGFYRALGERILSWRDESVEPPLGFRWPYAHTRPNPRAENVCPPCTPSANHATAGRSM